MTKTLIWQHIDQRSEQLTELAAFIGSHPELGHEEVLASGRLTQLLEHSGFRVERGVLGIPTAFIAEYDSGRPGPIAAFLCEYDALPELGHACGHHLICTMSAGAALGLQAALVAGHGGGIIRVYGTPAEETSGAKVPMAEAGLFDDCDFALMAHPFYTYERSGSSLAMDALQFEFFGKAAHAAANPEEGVNALDAVLLLFQSINAFRQQTRSDSRIHGIITNGGAAPNIIPDYAAARFYVRAASRAYVNELADQVKRCAEGAALQTGCRVEISNYELSYDELRTNESLSKLFTANLLELGVTEEEIDRGQDHGSLDLGNVSARCPSIHPYIKVVDDRLLLHTVEFRDQAMLGRAFQGMLLGAKTLAATAYDAMTIPGERERIRAEFDASKR